MRRVGHFLGQEDSAGAGAEDRLALLSEAAQRFQEAVALEELEEGCAFTAGNDEGIDAGELVGPLDVDLLDA